MCGIVGIISNKNSVPTVLKGLKLLEYRGYDSAGVGFLNNDEVDSVKILGKISDLTQEYNKNKIKSNIVIGHTRWATHGKPSKKNAHPFVKSNSALVHNGIIENSDELKIKYKINNKNLKSETDTEIIAEIFNLLLIKKLNPIKILEILQKEIKGTYAIAIIIEKHNKIYCTKKGSPLLIGLSDYEMSISSDVLGLPTTCKSLIYLEDNDISVLSLDKLTILNNKKIKKRRLHKYVKFLENIDKGNFKHFMLKEIFEQPISISNTLTNFTDYKNKKINLPKIDIIFNKISNIHLSACGTAYHACMISKYWFEEFTSIQTSVDISSEYRYRKCNLNSKSLGIVVSQSGETMDTLESLKKYLSKKIKTVSIINVLGSSISRKSNYMLPTIAGPEIGVASTKAFTTQLLVLALLSLDIRHKTNMQVDNNNFLKSLFLLPKSIKKALSEKQNIKKLIPWLSKAKSIFYIGRGTMYPLALEGALKLKEITYKHCEGYAAGELKHGPLALIEKNIPVIALAPYDKHFHKVISNIEEIKARDAEIIILTDKIGAKKINKKINKVIILPNSNFLTAPIIYSIPIQLIAYYLADFLKKEIDQPRNLAKSVTVE